VPLAGRPMVEWSIEAFREAGVEAIVVAVPPGHDYEPAAHEPHGSDAPLAPPSIRVLAGGDTRSASVSNALAVVETELVAIHDAARPLLSAALIEGVVATLMSDPEAAGAIAATPVTDTIKRASGEVSRQLSSSEGPNRRFVGETLDRAELWAAQTPQVFRVAALRSALKGDSAKVAAATDDAMLVEGAGGKVLIHPAEDENLKVTTALDLRLAEQLLAARS
jgi:2-C-methyl-D-erythritol 4-phosphate cytidylyltransferase